MLSYDCHTFLVVKYKSSCVLLPMQAQSLWSPRLGGTQNRVADKQRSNYFWQLYYNDIFVRCCARMWSGRSVNCFKNSVEHDLYQSMRLAGWQAANFQLLNFLWKVVANQTNEE